MRAGVEAKASSSQCSQVPASRSPVRGAARLRSWRPGRSACTATTLAARCGGPKRARSPQPGAAVTLGLVPRRARHPIAVLAVLALVPAAALGGLYVFADGQAEEVAVPVATTTTIDREVPATSTTDG